MITVIGAYDLFDLLASGLPELAPGELAAKAAAITARARLQFPCATGCGNWSHCAVVAEPGIITGTAARWLDLCHGCFSDVTRLVTSMPILSDELIMFDLYSSWAEDRRGGPLAGWDG